MLVRMDHERERWRNVERCALSMSRLCYGVVGSCVSLRYVYD